MLPLAYIRKNTNILGVPGGVTYSTKYVCSHFSSFVDFAKWTSGCTGLRGSRADASGTLVPVPVRELEPEEAYVTYVCIGPVPATFVRFMLGRACNVCIGGQHALCNWLLYYNVHC